MSSRPELLLVPGWGFGPGLWRPFMREIEALGWSGRALDPGWLARDGAWPERLRIPDDPLVMVGHSLGFLWLLDQLETPGLHDHCLGLVGIGGFSRFSRGDDFPAGVQPGVLASMRRKLARDPLAVLNDFRRRCGWQPLSGAPPPAGTGRLDAGLEWLETWDRRRVLDTWEKPLLALAGRDDPIVTPAMAEACFNPPGLVRPSPLHWLDGGGHVPQWTDPATCAARVATFLEENLDRNR